MRDLVSEPSTGVPERGCPAADGWRPIEAAPKDGTSILVFRDGEAHVARWYAEACVWGCSAPVPPGNVRTFSGIGPWRFGNIEAWAGPSHWQPLPAPPSDVRPPASRIPGRATSSAKAEMASDLNQSPNHSEKERR